MVVLLRPGATEQILLVSLVQHCLLVVQSDPGACGLHRLRRLHRFRFLASASSVSVASAKTATVEAAAPSAELRVVRRVLAFPASRVRESNRTLSTAASNLGGTSAALGSL
jgi:hypothetical protein